MTDFPRLIEHAFPLKQASLDSVHEKNVRHGHISTLHIWPARRPLAACRAALIATLLPDPSADPKPEGMSDAQWEAEIKRRRKELCEKIGGKVVKKIEKKKMPNGQTVERIKEETVGGILHWGRETENAETLEWFRQEIRKAYGGRAPKVLDPFAGGGAIPLEAMRLGCEATAVDINPVAWFILKCTLEYPQKLAGQKRPLPEFILKNEEFMKAFRKAHRLEEPGGLFGGGHGDTGTRGHGEKPLAASPCPPLSASGDPPLADLAWHVRAWGQWVLDRARRELAQYYPTYADFLPASGLRPSAQTSLPAHLPINRRAGFFVYVLRCSDGSFYIGQTENLDRRFAQHIDGEVSWTAPRRPVHLIHWEEYSSREEAVNREEELKTGFGRKWLKQEYEAKRLRVQLYERRLVPLTEDGKPDIDRLNREFVDPFLSAHEWGRPKSGPACAERSEAGTQTGRAQAGPACAERSEAGRWVAKPTVAYLWARTVTCKNCRATVPLLKTRWLCKKANKRVLLTMEVVEDDAGTRGPGDAGTTESADPGTRGRGDTETNQVTASPPLRVSVSAPQQVRFGIDANVPAKGGNAAQKREHDKRLGAGTMSRAGATCPCCGAINTMEDIRLEGKAGRLGSVMTAVVVDGPEGKGYRLPTEHERAIATPSEAQVQAAFKDVPFGVPDEPTPAGGGSGAGRAFSVQGYGLMRWRDLFTPRQLMALGTFVAATRAAREEMAAQKLPAEWVEAVGAYMACVVSRTADYMASLCIWENGAEEIKHVFMRWALPITWDCAEANPIVPTNRFYQGGLNSAFRVVSTLHQGSWGGTVAPLVENRSAITPSSDGFDLVFTDPPYYDAIPYSDLMDFFYIWLRRSLNGLSSPVDTAYAQPLSPKWDHDRNDGELIDDCSRHELNASKSRQVYEDGMARVFVQCATALNAEGRLVIVFANKQPDAWETLVAAVIRSGFCVDGSWPVATEMPGGLRNLGRASLASSVWLVCKKRPATARPGWDNNVLEEMKANIAVRLREFWDAGIRGPDFVWAATGPALEAYSKHPVVRKANAPGEVMGVGEFLNHVRRMVVDFVVGRVLSGDDTETRGLGDSGKGDSPRHRVTASPRPDVALESLDNVTTYYLLHRHDFGLDEAPAGACILYATACGLSDGELADTWDILARAGGGGDDADTQGRGDAETDEVDADETDEGEEGSGNKLKLKTWAQRKARSMGYEAPGGRPIPLIDRVHRLMHLWKAGDVHKVDEYLDDNALRRHELFKRLLQSLIELSPHGSDERSLLESLSNHVGAKGEKAGRGQAVMADETGAWTAEPSSSEE